MRGGGQIIAKMLSDDGLVMPQRTVRLYAIAASGRDAPMSMAEYAWTLFALRCSHVHINEMPRDVSAYQDDTMTVHESNKAPTCSASCQGVRWYLGSGDA